MADKKKKTPDTFMGQPVIEKNPGEFVVDRKGFQAIQDSLGVTKEVRAVVADCDNKVAEEGIKFCGAAVVATKAPAKLILGSGDGKTTIAMKGHHTTFAPKTRKPVETYGSVSISQKRIMPSALKSGVLADIQKDVEKAFS